MRTLSLLTILLFAILPAYSISDTIRIMHYNLLNYGNFPETYCTLSQNNPQTKDSCLRIIMAAAQPDILCVNELSDNQYYHQRILDSVLNYSGTTNFTKGSFTNFAYSYIVNQIYYNTSKIGIASNTVINTYVRDVNLYKLYLKNQSAGSDTAFFYCISAHLKAGSTATDKADRAVMTTNIMTWLSTHPEVANVLIMGDFNIQTSTETSYQNLINFSTPAFRFYDPILFSGSWNNNSSFAGIHTQSTHSSSNGCAASGGMDDRFDFMLISDEVRDGILGMQYVSGSYHAFGQDGNHFNQSINSGTNSEVSAAVAGALFINSDHLPVIADFAITSYTSWTESASISKPTLAFVTYDATSIQIRPVNQSAEPFEISLFDQTGRLVRKSHIPANSIQETLFVSLTGLSGSVFLLRINNMYKSQSIKIIKP